MEKENSSEEKPVENVDAPQEQHNNNINADINTKNELLDDQTVGPTTDTHVDAPEEQHNNINNETKNKLSDDQVVGPTTDTHNNISTDQEVKTEIANDKTSPPSVQLSNSEKPVGNLTDIENKDQEKGNLVNDTKPDIEIRKDNIADNSSLSSQVQLSNSENSVTSEPVIETEDHEKGNLVNDTALNTTADNIKTGGQDQEENNSTDKSSSTTVAQPNIQKEEQEKGNLVNDTALNTTADNTETGGQDQKENNSTDKSSSSTVSQPNIQKEEQEKGKSETEIDIKDHEKEDQIKGNSVNDTKDDLNGVTLSEETGDMKTDSKDNSTANAESTVVTKFRSLYAVSNIFRKLSRKPDEQNDSNNEKDKKGVNSSQQEVNQSKKPESTDEPLESPELKPIKGRIILYTKLRCNDCKNARQILHKRRLKYCEINIEVYPSRKMELEKMTGSADVPKVYFNEVLIGGLNELNDLKDEKIEYVTNETPSPKAPLPPSSGEDDESSKAAVDELAVIVKKMKESIVVKDRFYKFRIVTNCFLGSEAVDFLSKDQSLERQEAVEFGRNLAKELFFRHVREENIFEDGNHVYRFLDEDPIISQCQNISKGINQVKRQTLEDVSSKLRFMLHAFLDAYASEDGRHIAYKSIHESEEFARYLRIAEELQRVDLTKTSKEERVSFFINIYNLMAIHGILVWGHPEGALDRRKLDNEFKYVISGSAYSLCDIYNGILRANQRPPYTLTKPFALTDNRFKVALANPEPLIHFALVCWNRSGPALRCYSPKNVDTELMTAAKDFLQRAFVLDLASLTISVTKILKWYSVDFGRNEVEVLKHVANYLEVEKTQSLLQLLDSSRLKVVYQPYDWRLNT